MSLVICVPLGRANSDAVIIAEMLRIGETRGRSANATAPAILGNVTDGWTGYRWILFDLDHTLFDFEASKVEAFAEVMAIEGHSNHDELRAVLSDVERPLWQQLERGELNIDDLNRLRFERLNETAALGTDVDRMATNYLDGLGRSGGLLPGAREVLTALHQHCTLGLITNGYGEVQRPRMVNFDLGHYFDAVVISGEIGISKPDPRFFDEAFRQLGEPMRSDVLVVGDSLTSDIAGAVASGIDSCWFNPTDKPSPAVNAPTYIVRNLADVIAVAGRLT